MKYNLAVVFLICPAIFCMGLNAQEVGNNTIRGIVRLPVQQKKIVKGSGYNKDGTPMMHSEDPLARAVNNIIVVANPVSFFAKLSPTKDAIITQKAQTFIPHILPITKNSTVYFLNEDQFFHNVYSLTPGARFNIGRRPPGSPYPIQIKQTGIITLACDIHSHMKSYILSLETPYFTRANEKGNFELKDLPDGAYIIQVYYNVPDKMEKRIELKDGETLQVDFDVSKEKTP